MSSFYTSMTCYPIVLNIYTRKGGKKLAMIKYPSVSQTYKALFNGEHVIENTRSGSITLRQLQRIVHNCYCYWDYDNSSIITGAVYLSSLEPMPRWYYFELTFDAD